MMNSRLGGPPQRPWQFHLRTLLALMTLTAIALSIYARQQWREDYLVQQIEDFNAAMNRWQLEEAETITLEAAKKYPDEPILAFMLEKCRIGRQLEKGGRIEGGFQCYGE